MDSKRLSKIYELQQKIVNHSIYTRVNDDSFMEFFMKFHVFAVWDFMSLLKSLQNRYSCVKIPWIPRENNTYTRFINEIVLTEESDFDNEGKNKSHFEMYLDAMREVNISTFQIETFLDNLCQTGNFEEAVKLNKIDNSLIDFLNFNMDCNMSEKDHIALSVFAFSRELIIPEVFTKLLNNSKFHQYVKLKFYLERHVELDGDEHGPIAMKFLRDVCGADKKKWNEAFDAAEISLKLRISLWDRICQLLDIDYYIKKELSLKS